MSREIADKILKKRRLRAAIGIMNSIDEAVRMLRDSLLEAVKESVKKKCGREPDAPSNGNWAGLRYNYKASGIEVVLGDNKIDGVYTGYYTQGDDFADVFDVIGTWNSEDAGTPYAKFFYWEHCNVNGVGSPNFIVPNDALYALCDEGRLDEFADVCAEKIVRFLNL